MKVKTINLELTTRCNLKCPQCSRSNPIYPRVRNWDFDIDYLDKIFVEKLEAFILCGSFGDVIFYPHLFEFLTRTYKRNDSIHIGIHTNGSAHDSSWWKELSQLLKNRKHNLIFALDGLEDTHKIHRVGSDFNKIIENMKVAIDEGCHVVWQFIIFKHNEHQVVDAHKMARELGCSDFIIRKSFFYDDKFERPSSLPFIMSNHEQYLEGIGNIQCRIDNFEIAIFATGNVTPCCHIIPHTYKKLDFIPLNLKDYTLQEILDDGNIQKIWHEVQEKPFCQKCRRLCKNQYTLEQLVRETIKMRRFKLGKRID